MRGSGPGGVGGVRYGEYRRARGRKTGGDVRCWFEGSHGTVRVHHHWRENLRPYWDVAISWLENHDAWFFRSSWGNRWTVRTQQRGADYGAISDRVVYIMRINHVVIAERFRPLGGKTIERVSSQNEGLANAHRMHIIGVRVLFHPKAIDLVLDNDPDEGS